MPGTWPPPRNRCRRCCRPPSRGVGGGPDPFLANVVVEESYTLAAVGRGEAPDTRRIEDGRKLLALEAADGTTIFMRSDQEELARVYPEAVKEGQIDLSRLGTARSPRAGWGTGSGRRSRHCVDRDAIIDLALDQAKKRARLAGRAARLRDQGRRALRLDARGPGRVMWAIESQLAGTPA